MQYRSKALFLIYGIGKGTVIRESVSNSQSLADSQNVPVIPWLLKWREIVLLQVAKTIIDDDILDNSCATMRRDSGTPKQTLQHSLPHSIQPSTLGFERDTPNAR